MKLAEGNSIGGEHDIWFEPATFSTRMSFAFNGEGGRISDLNLQPLAEEYLSPLMAKVEEYLTWLRRDAEEYFTWLKWGGGISHFAAEKGYVCVWT